MLHDLQKIFKVYYNLQENVQEKVTTSSLTIRALHYRAVSATTVYLSNHIAFDKKFFFLYKLQIIVYEHFYTFLFIAPKLPDKLTKLRKLSVNRSMK